jgi:hypothetical protein
MGIFKLKAMELKNLHRSLVLKQNKPFPLIYVEEAPAKKTHLFILSMEKRACSTAQMSHE